MKLKDYLTSKNVFKDGMTFDEIASALEDIVIKTDEVDKSLFDKTASELAKLKKEAKEKMTADEAKKAEEEAAAAELADIKKKLAIYEQTEVFAGKGYDAETAKKLSEHLANGDMTKFAETSAAWMESQKEAMKKSLKDELLGGQNPPAQNNNGGEKLSPEVALAASLGKQTADTLKASIDAQNLYFGGI